MTGGCFVLELDPQLPDPEKKGMVSLDQCLVGGHELRTGQCQWCSQHWNLQCAVKARPRLQRLLRPKGWTPHQRPKARASSGISTGAADQSSFGPEK